MVFISYTHDSGSHSQNVLGLANQLREKGVDALIDQYKPHPSEGWPVWMEKQLEKARHVLVVCTDRYLSRSAGSEPPRPSGGKWESFLVYQDLYEGATNNDKFIPVLLEGTDASCIPKPLRAFTRYHLPDQFQDLYRRLTAQPKIVKPQLGNKEELPPEQITGMKTTSSQDTTVDTAVDRSTIELHFDLDFDEFNGEQEGRLLQALRLLLEDHDLAIKNKRRGSTIIGLDLSTRQAERLRWAVARGELDGVMGCRVQFVEVGALTAEAAPPARPHTLTKRALITRIASETGMNQQQVFDVVQKTLDHISEALAKGDKVELRNFGVFEVKVRKDRVGRNPNAPEKDISIPERPVVKFKAGSHMRAEVEGSSHMNAEVEGSER